MTVDEPQGFKGSIPAIWNVTSTRLAIIRLHGRNNETWTAEDLAASSERFNYDHTEDELAELGEPVRQVAANANVLHVTLNNKYDDQGVRAGRSLFRNLANVALRPEDDGGRPDYG